MLWGWCKTYWISLLIGMVTVGGLFGLMSADVNDFLLGALGALGLTALRSAVQKQAL